MHRARLVIVCLAGLLAVACKPKGATESPEGELSSGIKEIAAGVDYTAALFNDGHVRVIGAPLPRAEGTVRQVPFGGEVGSLAAGKDHACVLMEAGGVRCVGRNMWGALGYGNTERIANTEVLGDVPVGGKVVDLSAGHGYTCAVLDDRTVRCWGSGQGGRLGYGNANDVLSPAGVGPVPVGGPVRDVEAGPMGVTCAILESGAVRCWGQAVQGSLGYGTAQDVGIYNTPESMGDVALPGKVTHLAVGSSHVCALIEGGDVRCWGFGASGILGYPAVGNIGDDETPAEGQNVDLGGAAVELVAGLVHTCARLQSGSVRCWGVGRQGQLGYGDFQDVGATRTPAQAGDVPLGGEAKQLAAGPRHTCALLASGEVKCWGRRIDGVQMAPEPTTMSFADEDEKKKSSRKKT